MTHAAIFHCLCELSFVFYIVLEPDTIYDVKMNSYEVKTKLQGTFDYILVTDDEISDHEKFLSRGKLVLQKFQ